MEFKKLNYHELKELFDSPGGKQKISKHIQECYIVIDRKEKEKEDLNQTIRDLESQADGLQDQLYEFQESQEGGY